MKINSTKILTVLFSILVLSNAYSQNYTNKTFSVSGIDILYSGNNPDLNDSAVYSFLPNLEMDGVTEVKFLSDSIIKASSYYSGETNEIPLRNLNSIKVRTGSKFWMGAGIGAGAGLLIGITAAAVGYSSSDDDALSEISTGFAYVTLPIIGILTGGIIGGVIGGTSKTFETYDFRRSGNNRQEKLIKVLKSYPGDL